MNSGKILFVSDLDGTLLNSDCEVSRTSAQIINRVLRGGKALFTCATARTPATVVPMLSGIEIALPMIVMTGAAMWDNVAGDYTDTRHISADSAAEILRIFSEEGINPFVYEKGDRVLNVSHCAELTAPEQRFVDERKRSPFKHFIISDNACCGSPLLVFATGDYQLLEKVYRRITSAVACEAVCYHDIYHRGEGYLEIFAPGTTKANAIATLAQKTGARKTVCFGDNLNDISMFGVADVSVAVGNAYPEVKAAADIVIGDNDHDSVARWIEDNISLL